MDGMKPSHLLALILSLLTCPLLAQQTPPATTTPPTGNSGTPPGGDPSGKPKHPHPDFLSQLNLTDAQKAQIAQIKQNTPDHKQAHEQIMALLTPDQKAQLKQLHEQWRKDHPNAGKHGQGGAGGTNGAPQNQTSALGPQTSTEKPTPIPPPAH